jgi:dienelactone hydrolase
MGGGLALQLAIREPQLGACVVNYGPLPTNPLDIQKINAEVLAYQNVNARANRITPVRNGYRS